jgi:hypothetical protein
MNIKELVVIMFEKEIGVLKHESEYGSENNIIHSLTFLHKNKLSIKILLLEIEKNQWVIHHDLSRENPILSKKIVRICEKIQRIKSEKQFGLSRELIEIQGDSFIILFFKSVLQNLFAKHFIIFK